MTPSSQTNRMKLLLLCSTAGLLILFFVYTNGWTKTQCMPWGDVVWSSFVERRECIVLRQGDTNNDLRKVLHQCAAASQKCFLMMTTKEGHLKIDPSEMISGHAERPYHRLIEVVESDLDETAKITALPDDWQVVHLQMNGTSGFQVRLNGTVASFPDHRAVISYSLGVTAASHSKILWVLNAPLELPCHEVLITWNLLQQKGFPVWIMWENKTAAPIRTH